MSSDKEFAKILIKSGMVSKDQILDANNMARSGSTKISLAEALVKLGYATPTEVTSTLAKLHRLDFIDLDTVDIPDHVIELMPEPVARENIVVPVAETDAGLTVAISDPSNVTMLDNLRFILNRDVRPVLATRQSINEAINRNYGLMEGESADSILQEFTDTAIDFTVTEDDTGGTGSDELIDETSAPIVRLVQLMITEAVQLRASDIHVEPFEEEVRIRYRIDGVLHKRDTLPRRQHSAVISRIKILSKIDIAERRRPQDGRIKVTVGEKELDLRVSIIPTNHGQSAVLRLLDKDNIRVSVRQLGFSEGTYKQFSNLIRRPNGIILVTGPTGSGKTTTLYAGLNQLNRPDRKIITAKDPVEYYLPGINQVEVKHSIGLDFSRIIRSMLRQAPNIILVGEMRDKETVSMGIQASLTGHLVFSTLHTNDAPSAITRIIDMGVPGYLVASSVVAIIAQRLVRTNCPKCRGRHTPTKEILEEVGLTEEEIANATFMKGKGCGSCNQTGYKGRIGIYELMMMDSKIRELVFANASTNVIREYAMTKGGMRTLYQDGIEKVMGGITTFEEVYRVAKRTEQDR